MTEKRTPSHIILFSDDKLTICGIKADTVPYGLLRHIAGHKYDHPRCNVCYTHAGLEHMLGPDDNPPLRLFRAPPVERNKPRTVTEVPPL